MWRSEIQMNLLVSIYDDKIWIQIYMTKLGYIFSFYSLTLQKLSEQLFKQWSNRGVLKKVVLKNSAKLKSGYLYQGLFWYSCKLEA